MKPLSKITLCILFFGIVHHVFPQEMLYKSRQNTDNPFYNGNAVRDFLNQRTNFDTLWLPVSMRYTNDTIPEGGCFFEYHENGLLKKETAYLVMNDFKNYRYYNNTYRDPLMDVIDTIHYTELDSPIWGYFPQRRWYYNNRQADSSYWEEFYQIWDGEKWNTEERSYVHLLDTLTVSEFQDHVVIFDGEGNIKQSRETVLTFDDKGNVSEAVSDCFDLGNGQYKLKFVYSYDNEGKCSQRYCYFDTSGIWQYSTKLTDIKWFEFHGFDNGDMLFHGQPQGLYQYYSPKNKNKMSSLKYYTKYGDGTPYLLSLDTIKWNLFPFTSQFLSYYSYRMCLAMEEYYKYNEHYHRICNNRLLYPHWDCDTIPYSYVGGDFINKYDDLGRRYEYIWNTYSFHGDSINIVILHYTVDSFTYVLRPVGIAELPADNHTLLIVPNPSGETVRITAADNIADVSFYASDGRLAYSREGIGKEMNVNIQGLAVGVYVVQARLKNGGVQTGKVVVR